MIIEHAIPHVLQADSLEESIKKFAQLRLVNRELRVILSDLKTTEHFLKELGKTFKFLPANIAIQYQEEMPPFKAWLEHTNITEETIKIASHQAAKNIKQEIAHVDPNMAIDQEGNTPFMFMIVSENKNGVEKLLKYADPNLKNSRGWSPLICALKYPTEDLAIIKALLEAGADPNVQTIRSKTTPLMLAADSNNTEAIQLLLAYKADLSLKDKDGDTALSIAQKKNNQEAIKILNNGSGQKHK